jgi:Leucine-rich repeat (LRR) protein
MLFAAMTICAVMLGWIGTVIRDIQRQKWAVAALEHRGVYVEYGPPRVPRWLEKRLRDRFGRDLDYIISVNVSRAELGRQTAAMEVETAKLHRRLLVNKVESWQIRELERELQDAQRELARFDIDHFDWSQLRAFPKLEVLNLAGTKITDSDLEQIARLTKLKSLYLSETGITEKGLFHLQGLTSLEDLELSETKISDAGLAKLRPLTRLKTLGLSGVEITDAGLRHLKGLTALENLHLVGTRVTDAGMVHLSGLLKLTLLDLSNTGVVGPGMRHLKGLVSLRLLRAAPQMRDEGLAPIAALPQLDELHLGPKITDRGLYHLRNAKTLRVLNLIESQISDEGLRHLRGLKGLEVLFLDRTRITDAAAPRLQELARLAMLTLCQTEITDGGLMQLGQLAKLQRLYVSVPKVSNKGIKGLQAKLPNCEINSQDWHIELLSPPGVGIQEVIGMKDALETGARCFHLRQNDKDLFFIHRPAPPDPYFTNFYIADRFDPTALDRLNRVAIRGDSRRYLERHLEDALYGYEAHDLDSEAARDSVLAGDGPKLAACLAELSKLLGELKGYNSDVGLE